VSVNLNLCAHLFETCGWHRDLLFLACNAVLLLGKDQLQLGDSRLLALILSVLFKKFVKQHRVHLVIPYAVDVTAFVLDYARRKKINNG